MSLSIVWRQGFLLFARQWLQESPTRSQLTEREIQISSEAISITNTTFVGEGVVMIVAAWTHLRRVGWGSLWQEEGGQWASEKMRVIVSIKRLWMFVKTFWTLVNHYNCSFDLNLNYPKVNTTYTRHLAFDFCTTESYKKFTTLSTRWGLTNVKVACIKKSIIKEVTICFNKSNPQHGII